MSYKLDKYVIKSLESIKTYAMGNTDIMVPDIYLQKLTQYGGKIPTSDIVFEVYNIVLESDNKKLCPKMLSNVLDVFIMCGPFVPDEPNLKVFVSNLFVDTLFCMIVACCQKKVCSKKVMKLCQIVCEHYLNTCDFDFNFALMQKMSKCTKPMLTILKLLNRKEKSNKYVDFLRSQIVGDENRLLNEQLGGMYQEALLLNEFDEIKMLNDKILKMIGGKPEEKLRNNYNFNKQPTDLRNFIKLNGKEYWSNNDYSKHFNNNQWNISPLNIMKDSDKPVTIPPSSSGQSTPITTNNSPPSVQIPNTTDIPQSTSGQSTPSSSPKNETDAERLAKEKADAERLAKKTITIDGVDFVPGVPLTIDQINIIASRVGAPRMSQTRLEQKKDELRTRYGNLNDLSDEEL